MIVYKIVNASYLCDETKTVIDTAKTAGGKLRQDFKFKKINFLGIQLFSINSRCVIKSDMNITIWIHKILINYMITLGQTWLLSEQVWFIFALIFW